MKWSNRERKLNKRQRLKLQDKAHKEKGAGNDKHSKRKMSQILKEHRKRQQLEEEDEYWTNYNRR